jgi:hypothetical protein
MVTVIRGHEKINKEVTLAERKGTCGSPGIFSTAPTATESIAQHRAAIQARLRRPDNRQAAIRVNDQWVVGGELHAVA